MIIVDILIHGKYEKPKMIRCDKKGEWRRNENNENGEGWVIYDNGKKRW